MNTIPNFTSQKTLVAAAVASILLAACASAPLKPAGAAEVRNKLTSLQSDPNLASRAPVAVKEADAAVVIAETAQPDAALAAHRVYIADRKVDAARAQAETQFAEDQRPALAEQRESARLAARTHEADVARNQVATARAEGAEQKMAADLARSQADIARYEGAAQKLAADQARTDASAAANAALTAAANADAQTAELQRQIALLQARPTDRGLVLTLGDVLFTTGMADLKEGATGNLNKLVAFLNRYPDRSATIEGYTDNVGSDDYNRGLSERRADSVKSYLIGQGVGTLRLTAVGKGEAEPVADNASSSGRQQNRRVEVIITTPPAASR